MQNAADRCSQMEAALAPRAATRQCTADVIRHSVRLAMAPVIDSTKTMGIVLLPGAMTGVILAGALQAVRLQGVVMFMLLAAAALTATIMSYLAPGRLSTLQQLRRLAP